MKSYKTHKETKNYGESHHLQKNRTQFRKTLNVYAKRHRM